MPRCDKTEFTKSQIKKIELMSGRGMSIRDIAAIIGISKDVLYSQFKNDPVIKKAIMDGKAKARKKMTQNLFQKAMDDPSLMKYWLKTQGGAGWQEKDQLQLLPPPTVIRRPGGEVVTVGIQEEKLLEDTEEDRD